MWTIAHFRHIPDAAAGAGAGINRAFVFPMRGAGGAFDISPRAGARINAIALHELIERFKIISDPLGRYDRSLIPIESQPLQIETGLLIRPLLDARRIDVLDAQHDSSAA